MPEMFCPHCGRTDDDIGPELCGRGILGCPPAEAFDPTKQVLLDCRLCDKQRAVPAGAIMQGKAKGPQCPVSECVASLVLPRMEAKNPVMPELREQGIDQAAKPRSPKKATTR